MRKINNILALGGMIAGIVIFISLLESGESDEDYANRVIEQRDETRRFMQTSRMSPFKENNIEFKGLKYYEPDRDYQIRAQFNKAEPFQIIMLPTNDNKEIRYSVYGYADFSFKNITNRLTIYELADGSEEAGKLFIPFGDSTSTYTTYGGGRYLDVEHDGSQFIDLDFNMAYNPYCAYSPNYSCPLPPRENLLEIAIEAGEKSYE